MADEIATASAPYSSTRRIPCGWSSELGFGGLIGTLGRGKAPENRESVAVVKATRMPPQRMLGQGLPATRNGGRRSGRERRRGRPGKGRIRSQWRSRRPGRRLPSRAEKQGQPLTKAQADR